MKELLLFIAGVGFGAVGLYAAYGMWMWNWYRNRR